MKVLIIEDRQELADNVAQYLSSQDYLCEQATTKRDALMMVSLYDYDCILLDLILESGLSFRCCQQSPRLHRKICLKSAP